MAQLLNPASKEEAEMFDQARRILWPTGLPVHLRGVIDHLKTDPDVIMSNAIQPMIEVVIYGKALHARKQLLVIAGLRQHVPPMIVHLRDKLITKYARALGITVPPERIELENAYEIAMCISNARRKKKREALLAIGWDG